MAWKPSPKDSYDCLQRTGYLAGYSDGYHGFHYGAGYDDPPCSYRDGFDDGKSHARKCGWCGRDAQKVALQKTCNRHLQCTKAVRDHRASLYA